MQSAWNQPKLLQIEVLNAAAVGAPPDWSAPVRMVRAALSMPLSSEAEMRKIIPISTMPNSSARKGVATSAISTAAAPRSERTSLRMKRLRRCRAGDENPIMGPG